MKPKRGTPAEKAPQRAYRHVLLPAAILLAALTLRTVSVTQFPTLVDETITRDVVNGIWRGEWSNNWKFTATHADFRADQYNFSSYLYADALVAGVAGRLAPRMPNGDPIIVLWSRVFSVLAGTLGVFLFYLLARRLFGARTAIVAAALMAAMPLLVQDAHYARPEAFVVALTAAAYLLLRFDSHRGQVRYLGYAGFCFGVLIACKISLLPMALVPALFLPHLRDRQALLRAAAICAGGTLLGAFIGMPDAFFHPAAYWHGVQFLRHQYAEGTPPHASPGSANSIRLTAAYFWQTTGVMLLLSMAGVWVLARQKRFALLAAIGGPVAFYLVYFCSQRTFFERNLSHVAPLMAILAAVALTALSERIPAKSRQAALIGLVALTLAPALWVSSELVFIAMRTNSEQRAFQYEIGVLSAVRDRIDYVQGLMTQHQLDALIKLAEGARRDYLVRLDDYNDGFTKQNLEELKRRTNWREVGYFPSIFESMDVNTLIAYHSRAFRYVYLHPVR
jgi:hypothetical protein